MKKVERDHTDSILFILGSIEIRVSELSRQIQELTNERYELKKAYDEYRRIYHAKRPNGIRRPTLKRLYI